MIFIHCGESSNPLIGKITDFEQKFVLKYHLQTLECEKHYSEIGVDLLLLRR